MQVRGFPLDCFGGDFEFGLVLLDICLFAGLIYSTVILLAKSIAFPSQPPPSCGKYQVGEYSPDCFSVTVPLVVAACRVAMDVAFTSTLHQTLIRHQLPS